MKDPKEKEKLLMSTTTEQMDLLSSILQNDETRLENQEEREDDIESDDDQRDMERIRRQERRMGALTGADGGLYDDHYR